MFDRLAGAVVVHSLPSSNLMNFIHLFVFQVNIRGESRRVDYEVVDLLESIEKQPPFVEEFLLREDKTLEDYQGFLDQHSDVLHKKVEAFIQGRLEREINSETEHKHPEL